MTPKKSDNSYFLILVIAVLLFIMVYMRSEDNMDKMYRGEVKYMDKMYKFKEKAKTNIKDGWKGWYKK